MFRPIELLKLDVVIPSVTGDKEADDKEKNSVESLTPYTSSGDPILIQPVSDSDRNAIFTHLCEFFFRDEPLCVALDFLPNRQNYVELESFATKDLSNGCNVKAMLNGKVVGVNLNVILKRGYIHELEEVTINDDKLKKIATFLDHVALKSDIFSHFPAVDKALMMKFTSVDSMVRGRGIANELVNRTRKIAQENGCGILTADSTNYFSARNMKKLGFDCIFTLNYEDYKENGQAVFTPPHPHNAVSVYAQRI